MICDQSNDFHFPLEKMRKWLQQQSYSDQNYKQKQISNYTISDERKSVEWISEQ